MKKQLIKFEKKDCNPCAMVSELLEKKGVEYKKIDAFDNADIAMKFKIRTVPTVILLEDEVEIKRVMGYKVEELNKIIDMLG